MFEPKQRQIVYTIAKPSGDIVRIPVELNELGLATSRPARPESAPAASATDDAGGCAACERQHRCCQAEMALVRVIDDFDDLHSTDEVDAEVVVEGRLVKVKGPAPRALASLMGLLMASSGCPRLAPFQAMAVFHQPFATAEENIVRAAGFWLMRCWAQGKDLGETPFTALQAAWNGLEAVNRHIAQKLLDRCCSDAASNGIAYLDVLAKIGTLGLESALEVLRPVLTSEPQSENSTWR